MIWSSVCATAGDVPINKATTSKLALKVERNIFLPLRLDTCVICEDINLMLFHVDNLHERSWHTAITSAAWVTPANLLSRHQRRQLPNNRRTASADFLNTRKAKARIARALVYLN
ncbi:MAG: hypothetical protein HZB40_07310 [Rhodocyclales bacterium]|nr:hypothetical protein [Rhodocyclales bacterium]